MDIKIKTETMHFNYCARAIIQQDQKTLVMRVDDADYYHLPGGHVTIGETSQAAVLREVQEETGLVVDIKKLVVIHEQFYDKKGRANHSVIFYYLVKPKQKVSTENYVRLEQDGKKTNELRWVTNAELVDIDLRPTRLKNLILTNQLNTLQHYVN